VPQKSAVRSNDRTFPCIVKPRTRDTSLLFILFHGITQPFHSYSVILWLCINEWGRLASNITWFHDYVCGRKYLWPILRNNPVMYLKKPPKRLLDILQESWLLLSFTLRWPVGCVSRLDLIMFMVQLSKMSDREERNILTKQQEL
jgi:hypothetical protein